jgi:hypothetical protein
VNRILAHGGWSLIAVFAACGSLWAQAAPPGNAWSHGTTLSVSAGAATGSSETGAQVGGTIGWEITPRIAVEGNGTWFDRRNGAEAFAATLAVQAALTRTGPVAPFVEGGFGLYRASFDISRSAVPGFYRDRMTPGAIGYSVTNTFTDPAVLVGAGLNVFATPHIAIRPQVEAWIVTRNSQSYVMTAVAVRAAYHFENHPR